MQKRISIPLFFIGFFLISFAQAQVKIGDNPQVIDPSSILELESSDKVLVITRVDSLQMTTIVPNRGALVYNTTADCVYYYDGTAWISMCDGVDGGALTATPIVNSESTIVITPTAGGNNIEIAPNSISSDQILNGGINGVDIQDGSIGRGKLAPNAVDKARIAENAVGPYAIDRDSLPLSFFNNDIGFITGTDIVSGDADNAIEVGTDSGAFFDATPLETSIAANATAIAANNDNSPTNELQTLNLTGSQLSISGVTGSVDLPTADGSDTNINAGNNVTIQGNGTTATPYVINASAVDGSVTNELTDLDFDLATNILSLSNSATTAGSSVNLSSLAGGGGTADGVISDVVYTAADNNLTFTGTGGGFNGVINLDDLDGGGTGTNQTAAEVPVTLTATNYTAASQDVEAHLAGINTALAGGGGGDDNQTAAEVPVTLTAASYTAATQDVESHLVGIEAALATAGTAQNLSQVLATGNSAGNLQIADLGEPTLDQDAATKAYVDATVASGGTLTDGSILIGGTGDAAQQLVISGDATMDNAGVLTIEDEVIESANILDGTIDLADFNDMGATDNQILKWDDTAGSWVVASAASHIGNTNSIFFADINGDPTDDGDKFYWDPEGRKVGSIGYGALYVGLDGGPQTTEAKVHIADNFPGVGYALELQNQNANAPGEATGILFSTETVGTYGKGALVYESQESWARGDFHFLQNSTFGGGSDVNPDLNDKALTIKNNKDIQLYGNVIARNGPGAVGQVLTTNAAGETVWGTGTGSSAVTTDGTTITGDGTDVANAISLIDDAVTSAKIANATIALEDLSPMGATVNGEILKWDQDNSVWTIGTDDSSTGISAVAVTTSFTGDGTTGSELDIANDVITTDELAVDAVIAENIIDEAVTSAKIANNTIALEDLSPMGATTTGQVLKWDQDNLIWTIGTDDGGAAATLYTAGAGLALSATNEFSVNDLAGDVTGPTTATVIATDAITSEKIQDGEVETLDIAPGAITDTRIANDNVTPDKILQGTDGQVLTTSGTDVVWAAALNFAESNLTQTADRIYDLDGNNLSFDTGGGNIGIGALPGAPQDQLDVNGSVRSREGFNSTEGSAGAPGYGFYTNGDTDTGMFRASDDNLGFSTGGTEVIRIDDSQNVGIGTATPARKLHVAGNLQVDGGVWVATTQVHPDYVFEKYFNGYSKLKNSYNFKSLEEIESFVKKNNHLPGILSAEQIKDEGSFNLSNANTIHLEKIEELFLHTIEQEKEINRLKAEKEAMANELKTMKNDIEEIKALLNK
ncbi:beta strand repeat-containing protein [Zobellia nedashkovskayae]|uniref:beta strand repeat-containing protein n=1 Tax=Zobellia nedashkovskayae TaxID=2779510 RepID=UPI00188CE436|nr:hypothetical protein [Zobellia nedashkovskayae]